MAETTVRVNGQVVRVSNAVLDARHILECAGMSPDEYDLFCASGMNCAKMEMDAPVKAEDGTQYNAILKSVPFG